MIIPMHDNRFFSSMSQVFERLARERHWYPIVVSTLRDPALELQTVEYARSPIASNISWWPGRPIRIRSATCAAITAWPTSTSTCPGPGPRRSSATTTGVPSN